MHKFTHTLLPACVLSLVAVQLSGCEASDLDYFNVAAQCYSNYPDNPSAQQQCVNQGYDNIQYYQEAANCDNVVNRLDNLFDEYEIYKSEFNRISQFTYTQVESFRNDFRSCVANYDVEQCEEAQTKPILANISYTIEYLIEFQSFDTDLWAYRDRTINQCRNYYTFSAATGLSSRYFQENHEVISAWRDYVRNTTNSFKPW